MKILVTGGAGFIGSHLVDAYIKRGAKVGVLDLLLTGRRKNLNPRAAFYKADIRNLKEVERIIGKFQPDVISHQAAVAEVIKSMRDPIPTLQTNVLGTVNVALAFGLNSRSRNKKFIFASTGGAIYGEPRKIPASEDSPAAPISAYGLSKKLGEEAVRFYSRQFGYDYTILRYANVYGPRQNPKGEAGVVAIFGGLMKAGKRPKIFGDGTKTRDYVHVADVVRANLLALQKGSGATLNLGWGREISDREVYKAVSRATGFKGKPIFAAYRPGEIVRITLDARRAKKTLGWSPKVAFFNGVEATVKNL